MLQRIRSRMTYANVMATGAMFIALGGVSYAAVKLPKNSVGSKQIKANAVTGSKVRNSALTGADIKDKSLSTADFGDVVRGPAGTQGPAGLQGPAGAKGDTGARGPSDAYYVFNNASGVDSKSLDLVLPAGNYAVAGSMYAVNKSTSVKVDTRCDLTAATDPNHDGSAIVSLGFAASFTYGVLTTQTVLRLPSGGTAHLVCQTSGTGSAEFYQARILATKVETLN